MHAPLTAIDVCRGTCRLLWLQGWSPLTEVILADGHRADITLIKTAITLAALAGREQAGPEDIRQAARLALPHRMRRRPFEEGTLDWTAVEAALQE